MTTAAPVSAPREVFQDARGPERVLRTSWHPGERLVAFSVWAGRECLTTFRLPAAAVPELVGVLVRGLASDEPTDDPAHASANGPSSGEALPRTGALAMATPLEVAQPETPESPAPRRATDVLRRASVRALDRCARGAAALRDRLAARKAS